MNLEIKTPPSGTNVLLTSRTVLRKAAAATDVHVARLHVHVQPLWFKIKSFRGWRMKNLEKDWPSFTASGNNIGVLHRPLHWMVSSEQCGIIEKNKLQHIVQVLALSNLTCRSPSVRELQRRLEASTRVLHILWMSFYISCSLLMTDEGHSDGFNTDFIDGATRSHLSFVVWCICIFMYFNVLLSCARVCVTVFCFFVFFCLAAKQISPLGQWS